ncbi:hypothetical protein CRYUN_Cryun22dG0032100 [Craigia yunnanensis]
MIIFSGKAIVEVLCSTVLACKELITFQFMGSESCAQFLFILIALFQSEEGIECLKEIMQILVGEGFSILDNLPQVQQIHKKCSIEYERKLRALYYHE